MTVGYLQKKETVWRIVGIIVITALILLIYPSNISFLISNFTSDSAVFATVADGWKVGFLPYRDLFDHKGPLIYLIQIIGGWMPISKLGIWLLDVIMISATFEMLFRCGEILGTSKWLNYLSLVFAALIVIMHIDGGNGTEDYSLCFETLSLLLTLKYLRNTHYDLRKTAIIIGACFGAVSMLRINNNYLICGLVLAVIAKMIHYNQYKEIFKCIGWFSLGLILTVVPFIIYFAINGALYDFVYCNYIFNFLYKQKWTTDFSLKIALYHLYLMKPCLYAIMISAFYGYYRGKRWFLAVALPALIFIVLFLKGKDYSHYFLLQLPLMAVCIQMLVVLTSRLFRIMVLVLITISFIPIVTSVAVRTTSELNEIKNVRNRIKDEKQFLLNTIPPQDRDSIYVIGGYKIISAMQRSKMIPVGKYFFLHNSLSKVDSDLRNEIVKCFIKVNPKWVLSEGEDLQGIGIHSNNSKYKEITCDSVTHDIPSGWRVFYRED